MIMDALGVLCGWRTSSRILFDVPPSAFVPPPEVTSSVVHLEPRERPLRARSAASEARDPGRLRTTPQRCFDRASRSVMEAPAEVVAAAGLEGRRFARKKSRSEGFVCLANAWDESLGREPAGPA